MQRANQRVRLKEGKVIMKMAENNKQAYKIHGTLDQSRRERYHENMHIR